jgi:hypothetical protein
VPQIAQALKTSPRTLAELRLDPRESITAQS